MRLRDWVTTRRRMLARLDEQDRQYAGLTEEFRGLHVTAQALDRELQAAQQEIAVLDAAAAEHASMVRRCRAVLVRLEATAHANDDDLLHQLAGELRAALDGAGVPT